MPEYIMGTKMEKQWRLRELNAIYNEEITMKEVMSAINSQVKEKSSMPLHNR